MCLNQGALSCSGTHFIKPSSWGRGSMRPHIYHTNPSGLSTSCTDSMCVIGARPPDQAAHWLPALLHFHFHLPLSVLRFSICTLPLPLLLWRSQLPSRPPLSFISLLAQFFFLLSLSGFLFFLFLFFHGVQMLLSSEQIPNPAVSPLFHFISPCVTYLSLPVVWDVSFSRVKIGTVHCIRKNSPAWQVKVMKWNA